MREMMVNYYELLPKESVNRMLINIRSGDLSIVNEEGAHDISITI